MKMNNGRGVSFERQRQQGVEYPNYPPIGHQEALRRLKDDSLWIRSVNLEYYYSYAVVEDGETGDRFVLREPISDDTWKVLVGYLIRISDA